jgi:hypothetical protein
MLIIQSLKSKQATLILKVTKNMRLTISEQVKRFILMESLILAQSERWRRA